MSLLIGLDWPVSFGFVPKAMARARWGDGYQGRSLAIMNSVCWARSKDERGDGSPTGGVIFCRSIGLIWKRPLIGAALIIPDARATPKFRQSVASGIESVANWRTRITNGQGYLPA